MSYGEFANQPVNSESTARFAWNRLTFSAKESKEAAFLCWVSTDHCEGGINPTLRSLEQAEKTSARVYTWMLVAVGVLGYTYYQGHQTLSNRSVAVLGGLVVGGAGVSIYTMARIWNMKNEIVRRISKNADLLLELAEKKPFEIEYKCEQSDLKAVSRDLEVLVKRCVFWNPALLKKVTSLPNDVQERLNQ